MSEGKRPGGLTALAIINLVFSAFTGLGALGMIALLALMDTMVSAVEKTNDAEAQAQMAAMDDLGAGFWMFLIAMSLVSALLLLLSGIGYLQQKKFLGRTMGNAYAVLGVAGTAISAMQTPEALGGGFNLSTILGLIYPVLTLIFINGTFKEDFTR